MLIASGSWWVFARNLGLFWAVLLPELRLTWHHARARLTSPVLTYLHRSAGDGSRSSPTDQHRCAPHGRCARPSALRRGRCRPCRGEAEPLAARFWLIMPDLRTYHARGLHRAAFEKTGDSGATAMIVVWLC